MGGGIRLCHGLRTKKKRGSPIMDMKLSFLLNHENKQVRCSFLKKIHPKQGGKITNIGQQFRFFEGNATPSGHKSQRIIS